MDPQVNESEGKLVCFSYRSKENKVTEVERGRFFSCYNEDTSTEEKDK